jgi:hypothetical protein
MELSDVHASRASNADCSELVECHRPHLIGEQAFMSEGFEITSESGYLSVDVKRFSELRKECANRCGCGYCRLGKESAYAVARRAYR